jgi:hypothetical protein
MIRALVEDGKGVEDAGPMETGVEFGPGSHRFRFTWETNLCFGERVDWGE